MFILPDTVLGVGDTMMTKQTWSLSRWIVYSGKGKRQKQVNEQI